MGFILASGLGRPVDAAQALVYWFFAASANQTGAQLALGYRHAFGFSVPKVCASAVMYYTPAALAALAPPPGSQQLAGQPPPVERLRLSADFAVHQAARARERDMVGYYRYSADHGNTDAAAAMGQLLVSGARGVARDFGAAAEYLSVAASRGDADAQASLGMLFANGQGVERDDATAVRLLRAAADKGQPMGQYGLGLAFLGGFGVVRDTRQALAWLVAAAEQGSPDAHAALGALHAQGLEGLPKDRAKALLHLNTAAANGHLLASFAVAMLQLNPGAATILPPAAAAQAAAHAQPGACRASVALLKQVAERGDVVRTLIQAAGEAFSGGDDAAALRLYLKGAHMGIEVAQANAAFLLQRRSSISAASLAGAGDDVAASEAGDDDDGSLPVGAAAQRLALAWLARSAEQGHVASLVAVGDAHFYGRGKPVDLRLAAQAYAQAGSGHNAQALFNLGTMHHFGWGLPQDFHLAKRYYDLARAAAAEARMPTALALWALRWQQRWRDWQSSSSSSDEAVPEQAAHGAGGAPPQAKSHRTALGSADVESVLLALVTGALALVVGAIRARRAAALAAGGEEEGDDGDVATAEGRDAAREGAGRAAGEVASPQPQT